MKKHGATEGKRNHIKKTNADRRKEHLGTSDQAIITARRRLMSLARDLQNGVEPFPATHGNIYRVRAMDVNTALDNYDAVIAEHGDGL